MDHLPVSFNVRDKRVLVAGDGTVAARRAEMVLRAGARVELFARRPGPDCESLLTHPRLRHIPRELALEDLEGAVFVFAAHEDEQADGRIEALARAAGVPVNVANSAARSDFIMPAILDRSPLVVAISSSGASPILARIIKARFETLIPSAFGRLAGFIGSLRDEVAARLKEPGARRRFWERTIEGPTADLLMAGDEAAAREEFRSELAAAGDDNSHLRRGEVFLVGAGPGDPDLLTFRALRLMQRADVVLYDRLIGDRILDLVRREAVRIDVGKLPRKHTLPQHEISQLLVELAKDGKRVLRLKGGDPFIFGRGGEEIEALASEGIPFQVVPGITAAAGCAAYAGIPLTHRDHAQACVFVTGHGKDGRVELDWKTLLQPRQTVAIYMGLSMLEALTEAFIERGADREMPVAVIDRGTRKDQKVVTGTLADIAEKVLDADLKGPAMIIIGTVVTLREKLAWYLPEPSGARGRLAQAAKTAPAVTPGEAE